MMFNRASPGRATATGNSGGEPEVVLDMDFGESGLWNDFGAVMAKFNYGRTLAVPPRRRSRMPRTRYADCWWKCRGVEKRTIGTWVKAAVAPPRCPGCRSTRPPVIVGRRTLAVRQSLPFHGKEMRRRQPTPCGTATRLWNRRRWSDKGLWGRWPMTARPTLS